MVGPALDGLLEPASGCGQVPHVGVSERNFGRFWRTPLIGSLRNQLERKGFAQTPDTAEQRTLIRIQCSKRLLRVLGEFDPAQQNRFARSVIVGLLEAREDRIGTR